MSQSVNYADSIPSSSSVKEKHGLHEEAPEISLASCANYVATRFPTLFDLPVLKQDKKWYQVLNPVPGLRLMNRSHWNFYLLGWLAWVVDSMDFFCVSASATDIAKTLNVSTKDITWGITLVLMLRSVGAVIFGMIADTYGRKKPYIAICLLFMVVELGTGFITTYKQFLGVRAVFGILMGAMYPIALVTALENQPPLAKSVALGLFLPGYNVGYILATVFFRAFEFTPFKGRYGEGWRNLFFFLAGVPLILVVWRSFIGELPAFIKLQKAKQKAEVQRKKDIEEGKIKKLLAIMDRLHIDHTLVTSLKTEWLTIIMLIIVLSLFNFISHSTQDLYTTFLVEQRKVEPNMRTVTLVVVNLGAVFGGMFFGQLSEVLGRRLTIMICLVWAGAFLYPAFMLSNLGGIIPLGFFLQFGVMGAWGVAPIYIMEVCGHAHRALITGTCYQLGNLALSASLTIEATLGLQFPLEHGFDYGKVMCIFCGAIFGAMILVIFFAYERFDQQLTIDDDDLSTIHHYDGEQEVESIESDEKAAPAVEQHEFKI